MSRAAQMSGRAWAVLFFLAAVVSGCSDGATRPTMNNESPRLSGVGTGKPPAVGDTIPGEFIALFEDAIAKSNVDARSHEIAAPTGGSLRHVYHAVKGFAIKLPERASAEALRHLPGVASVEPNRIGLVAAVETVLRGASIELTRARGPQMGCIATARTVVE